VRLEGLGQLKTSNGLIGNRTRELPACSIVPQPTTLPRPHCLEIIHLQKCFPLQQMHATHFNLFNCLRMLSVGQTVYCLIVG
jgi:hypothetical protein